MYTELKQVVMDVLRQSGKSQKQLAKEIAVSPATVSQFLAGKYIGDNEEVSHKLKHFLTLEKQRLNSVQSDVFYPGLNTTGMVLSLCNRARVHSEIALVCGAAGTGKTTALNYYKNNNTGAIMCTADACTKTASALLRLLCETLGKKAAYRKADMMKTVLQQLTGSNRLLIVDEADHLTLEALQVLRAISEKAGIGLVLSGNTKIYHQMFSARNGGDFDQIRTRILMHYFAKNEYTVEEISGIFPKAPQDCIGMLLAVAERSSLRIAKKAYNAANEIAAFDKKQLSMRILKHTVRTFLNYTL